MGLLPWPSQTDKQHDSDGFGILDRFDFITNLSIAVLYRTDIKNCWASGWEEGTKIPTAVANIFVLHAGAGVPCVWWSFLHAVSVFVVWDTILLGLL